MIAARSVRVIVRGIDLGRRLGRRRDRGPGRRARATSSAGSSGGASAGRAPATPAACAARRLAPEQADPARARSSASRTPGVAVGAVQQQPGAQLGLGVGALVGQRRPARSRRRRGSIARLLIRISWLATATNAADVAEPVVVERRERVEVGVGERAERHGQDVELARLDERQQQGRAARRTRRAGPASRPPGRRPSPNTTDGVAPTGMPASRRSISSPRPRAAAARPHSGSTRRVLVADQLDGPWRAARRRSASTRRRLGVVREPLERRAPARAGRRPTRQTHGAVRLAERVRDARPRRPVSPLPASWSSPASEDVAVGRRPAPRSVATTSRPCRRSATCIESNSASCGGLSQVASAARSSGATRARTCDRNWRTLLPHQDAEDGIGDRDTGRGRRASRHRTRGRRTRR